MIKLDVKNGVYKMDGWTCTDETGLAGHTQRVVCTSRKPLIVSSKF